MDPLNFTRHIVIAAICLALNVGLGKTSNILGLPFAMDTVGTILAAALLPPALTLLVACLSSLAAGIVINPAFLFYVGTQIVIALLAIFFVRQHFFSGPWKAGFAGLILGIASAVVSAPVTAIVFGGVATPSISAVNAVFLAAGESLWKSVLQGSLIVESIDKIVAGIIVWLTLRRLPQLKQSYPTAP
jgi:energy-coupling factor transport system substrate-specific component